ncbi:uncharacterized protein [Drosophila kikkawai]|uniref:Uncharacterized protein n=1 Tax=Drosophila kikkawai TaxID=30033 RepID=A0A6P4JE56_DROKI|nr:uncharacterized protein LOC108082760 [Drosophila kikkawai]
MHQMFPNPIELFVDQAVQPIIDSLAYLLKEVHYFAFIAAVALLGIFLGLVFGFICVIWYKSTRNEKTEKKVFKSEEGEAGDLKKKA